MYPQLLISTRSMFPAVDYLVTGANWLQGANVSSPHSENCFELEKGLVGCSFINTIIQSTLEDTLRSRYIGLVINTSVVQKTFKDLIEAEVEEFSEG